MALVLRSQIVARKTLLNALGDEWSEIGWSIAGSAFIGSRASAGSTSIITLNADCVILEVAIFTLSQTFASHCAQHEWLVTRSAAGGEQTIAGFARAITGLTFVLVYFSVACWTGVHTRSKSCDHSKR